MAYRSTALMTIAPYKYLISDSLDNCGNIYINSAGVVNFDTILNFLFDEVKFAFEKEQGKSLDNINIEFIDSPLPYASIKTALEITQLAFLRG